MQDIDLGFRVGRRHFAWGVTADEAADALGVARDEGRGTRWRRIKLACGPSWSFETISAELTAHGADRPVTDLRYELAAPADDALPDPARWTGPLGAALGAPVEAGHHDLPTSGDLSGSVRYYASWQRGDQSVGLSLYGAARRTEHGCTAGCLWLTWSTQAAARPFVAEWRHRAEALVAEADIHSGILTFVLGEPSLPALGGAEDEDAALRDSRYALDAPQLLPTPPGIARLLGRLGVGFWRSGDHRRWHASHHWDTIGFAIGEPIVIDLYDVKPAKGGGFAEIAVDGWRVRDRHGSRAIAQAVEALRSIAGVSIRVIDGYDC